MPELPEVEAVRQLLLPKVTGERITGVVVHRCATESVRSKAARRRIEGIERRGKHILVRLSGGKTLHVHLRMSGNLFFIPDHRMPPATARVLLRLGNGGGIVFEDARALGRMELVDDAVLEKKLAALGPEPLSREFTAERLVEDAARSKQPAKLFLMDQKRIAGLGNIYAAEALFRARVNPRKAAKELSRVKVKALHTAIVGVLRDAVESARIAYSGPGHFGEEEYSLEVYGKAGEPCPRCERKIRRIRQGGRSTYYCPQCQR